MVLQLRVHPSSFPSALPFCFELVPFAFHRVQAALARSNCTRKECETATYLVGAAGRGSSSLKYGASRASAAVTRLSGSYVSRRSARSSPAGESHLGQAFSTDTRRQSNKGVLCEHLTEVIGNEVFWLHELIPGQTCHPWPLLDYGGANNAINHIQLVDLVVALEDWLLREQLEHDAP